MAEGEAARVEPVRPCPLRCSAAGQALGDLATTAGIAFSRSRFTLARCGCGELIYLSPLPTESDLRAMYVENAQFGDEYTDKDRARKIVRYMRLCLERIAVMRAWPRKRTLKVLEVGAGLSWMCRAAKLRNVANLTVAQDVSPEAVASCAWVDHYVLGEVSDERLDAHAPYDIVSMTHVIEHLVDPIEVLARCRSLLARDGIVFVTAPYRPRNWREASPDLALWTGYSYNHVPAHLQYFSEGSMRRLAQVAGFELVHWSHTHDEGQAFEAWLAAERLTPLRSWLRRMQRWTAGGPREPRSDR